MRAAVALLGLALVACGPPPKTAAERCWHQVRAARMGRSMRPDPHLDELENIRCTQIETQERAQQRAEQREDAAEQERQREASAQAEARDEAMLAKIRQDPAAPEPGATSAEIRGICERQRGRIKIDKQTRVCFVGRGVVFAVLLEQDAASRVDVIFEGGELGATRAAVEAKLGPPDGERRTDDGKYRLFYWDRVGFAVAGSETGVRVTRIQRR